jgi:glycosyltransferase involved in cell wall biosynthesis
MRTHRVFSALQPWQWRNELLSALVGAANLRVARIEPVTRGREPAAFIDLHFSDGERAVTVPLVYVDLAQLDVRESDPLVFPHGLLGVVPDARASEVVERLFPELERRALTGGFWAEDVIRFAPAPVFDRARERGFFGAAPLAISLPPIAGAVYAQRFAASKHAVAYGAGADAAAAFVRGGALSCGVVAATADDDARAWYGTFDAADPGASYDLAVGSGESPARAVVTVRLDREAHDGVQFGCAVPLPADMMIAFDAASGAGASAFTVAATREPFTREADAVEMTATASGSAGRIALVVRPDAAQTPDADSDEAFALARALRREGFEARVLMGIDALAAFAPDLVHLFGVRPGGHARQVAEWANDRSKPLVVHAFHESPARGGYWGAMVTPYCFGYSADDRSVSIYLDLLARRAVEVDGVTAHAPFAPTTAGLPDSERVLSMADVVLVNSDREREAIEPFRPGRATYVVPPLAVSDADPAPIGAYVGTDPFILVHAPISPEANQLVLARAAGELGVATVFAGAVADPAYAERLREFAPRAIYLLDEPSPELVAGLYRAASIVADASWIARGHGRLLTAAALGAGVVCSQNTWLELPDDGFWAVDPADVRSVARGLGVAWDNAYRGEVVVKTTADLARKHVQTAAAGVITAYAKIVQAV